MTSKMKEFDDYSHDLANRVDALFKIAEFMPKNMPSGSVIRSQLEDGNQLDISKKQLLMKKNDLIEEIHRELPRKFRKARKRKRQADPASFSGAYTPVVVSKVLIEFLKRVGLGRVDPKDPTSELLINHLTCAQQGYGLRNSFQLIWFLAIYYNEMQNPEDKTTLKPNKAMAEIFGSPDYPSRYINVMSDDGKFSTTKNTEGLSTFEVMEYRSRELEKKEKGFDRECFKIYCFPAILSLNIYKSGDLVEDIRETLKSEPLRQQLLKEYQILQKAKENWKTYIQEKKEMENKYDSEESEEIVNSPVEVSEVQD